MTAETIVIVASTILSLGFSYIPGLQQKFDPLEGTYKRLIMLGLLVVVAGGSFALSCSQIGAELGIGIVCDKGGAVGLVKMLILAIMANQSTYMITPKR